MQRLNPGAIRVEPRDLDAKVALFSVDVETDYGTGRTEALSQLDRVVALMAELGVPWTAFIEGRLFETRPEVCRLLRDHGVDLQLHCYDHSQPGDTPESLGRSAAVFADFTGHRPRGYRAHTYRLTQTLFEALEAEGFRWDSSVMRAYAQGRNPHPALRQGDYLLLNDLVEFPIATWRGLPLALNHTHLLLLKRPGELALRALAGPGRLVTYNFHMTDLVRCDSLRVARRSPMVRWLHRYAWSTHGRDTFHVVRRFARYLRARGYEYLTTDSLYERVAEFRPRNLADVGAGFSPPGPAKADPYE